MCCDRTCEFVKSLRTWGLATPMTKPSGKSPPSSSTKDAYTAEVMTAEMKDKILWYTLDESSSYRAFHTMITKQIAKMSMMTLAVTGWRLRRLRAAAWASGLGGGKVSPGGRVRGGRGGGTRRRWRGGPAPGLVSGDLSRIG